MKFIGSITSKYPANFSRLLCCSVMLKLTDVVTRSSKTNLTDLSNFASNMLDWKNVFDKFVLNIYQLPKIARISYSRASIKVLVHQWLTILLVGHGFCVRWQYIYINVFLLRAVPQPIKSLIKTNNWHIKLMCKYFKIIMYIQNVRSMKIIH